jgi:hypothetical protein
VRKRKRRPRARQAGDRPGDDKPERNVADRLGAGHLGHANADHRQDEMAPKIISTAPCSSRTRRVIVAICWSVSGSFSGLEISIRSRFSARMRSLITA